MKLLYVTDLHGDKNKHRKSLDIAVEKNIGIIVNGGDMLPKLGERHLEQPIFINEFLRGYFSELERHGIIYLAMLGNDDLLSVDGLFDTVCREFENVHNIAGKKVRIGRYEFIGMNYILDHPFGCKDRVVTETNYIPQKKLSPVAGISNEYGYDRIYNWLEYSRTKLPYMCDILNDLPEPENPQQMVYVMHMPPAGLRLGQLLYQDMDIGSVDIYEFLKETQPQLSLHGHIHESPDTQKGRWINQIRDTACIQVGQTELHDNDMVYAEIDLQSREYSRKVINVK
ncbi:metallophosphoesterase [Enterocloster clostridioformis]|uniref:metallophosphoesterase family protein n=1 Tax=Enterocloster clostridioformis TaxID=1531 RepID=UPI0026744F05|nr:metallophosphoesterase [Enterocloster clostridioformis]